MVSLPVSPISGKTTKIDRGCSPVWGADVSAVPSPSGRGGKEVGTVTSSTHAGGLTSAETSLMTLLEGVLAEKEASRGEINRLREEFESLSRNIVSLAGETRKVSAAPIEGKKKKVKKKRDITEAALLPQAPVLGINHVISHETFHFPLYPFRVNFFIIHAIT
ncbi:unnamed protein product [Lasius platythorax]|uniref:Uncharacterized protein n=1 Tax=Lasius platythorax TaxID=488582 RepID=A0AAV2NBA5_9HYME